jgi:glycosyltransferase involved in cell wall biosynthesis
MRVGMVTQFYDPEGGSAAVPGAIARALVARGHDVHVLTGFPNYPSGQLALGYRVRPYQFEARDGVSVHRVPLMPSHDRSVMRRSTNYLSFALSAAIRPLLLRKADVWLVYSSPATAALPAMVAKTLFGRPYVLLVQDLWPDSVVGSGFVRSGVALRAMIGLLEGFCRASYALSSAVAVTSPGMAKVLGERGVPDAKLAVVPNWVDEALFRPLEAPAVRPAGLDGFVVMYGGNIGDLQGLDTAVEALALLPDLPDLRLVFVGSGIAEERLRQAAARDRRVVFLGQQPADRMPDLMAASDVQLVSLKDLPLFRSTVPSKLQAVLAAGRPVVAALAGDARQLVEDAGAGVAVAPEDPAALAAAIRRLYELPVAEREALGRRGREYYVNFLSEEVGRVALEGLLGRALSGPEKVQP